MANAGTIAVNIVAYTGRFSGPLNNARGALGAFGGALRGVLGPLGAFGVGMGAIGAMTMAVEKLNQAMARSTAIAPGISQALKTEMRAAAIELSGKTQFSAVQLAEAYTPLISSGMGAKEALEALPIAANFAQAANEDLTTSTNNLTKAMTSLGLASTDPKKNAANMKRISDAMTAGNIVSTATVSQMGLAMARAGGAMRRYGVEVEEGSAILAAFISRGLEAEEAATALDMVWRDIAKAQMKHTEAWKDANIEVAKNGKYRDLVDIIKDLEVHLDKVSEPERLGKLLELGFPSKSVRYINTLIGISDKIRDMQKRIEDLGDITDLVARASLTPFQYAWYSIRMEVMKFADQTMPDLLGVVRLVIRDVGSLTKAINEFVGASKTGRNSTVRFIITLLASIAVFKIAVVVLGAVVRMYGQYIKIIKAATVAEAIKKLFGGPKDWLILGGALLGAGATAIYVTKLFEELDAEVVKTLEDTKKLEELGALKEDIEKDMKLAGGPDSFNDFMLAKQRMEDLKKKAAELTEELRTPWEVFSDTIRELFEMLNTFDDKGNRLIDLETYNRGINKAAKELMETHEKIKDATDVDVKVKGTTEEYSARSKYMANVEKMTAYLKAMAVELAKIEAEIKAMHATFKATPRPMPATLGP